jgi:photosystem II stability/assembly factor-like uncharacterized protein
MEKLFKNLKNLLFLFFFFYSVLIYSQGFNSVFSSDGSTVIAVGNGGNVFRSIDGGATFTSISLGLNNLYGVYSVNRSIWIAAQNGVYISTDAGNSFNFNSNTGTIFKSIFFIDENTGWVVGNNGTVSFSTDGGMSWFPETSGTSNDLNSVRFANVSTGVACGKNGTLIYTTNSGVTWNLNSNLLTNNDLLSIDIKGSTAIATGEDGFILTSTNSGANWSYIDFKILTRSQVRGVSITGPNTFYTCGGGGFIRKSTDGGNSYTFQQNPMMADLSAIYFLDTLQGWAVSSKNNALLRTSDGGNSWLLPAGTTVSFSWVEKLATGGTIGNSLARHPRNKNGMFVVCGSNVYRSLDLGETWTLISYISFSGEAHSFYVFPKDTNKFIASIGESQGRVVKSTNYGLTWTSVWGPGLLTDYGVPMTMDPSHPYIIYLAPNSSPILRSTNFGDTWSSWSNFTFNDPCDIVVLFGNSNLIYFGDQNGGGKVYKSTDSGVNWNLLISPGGSEIPMIGATNLDLNRVFFTNWGGTGFWRSTNAGNNWAEVVSDGDAWGTDVAKDDPTAVAFATWGNGLTYISTNGGDNFINLPSGDYANYGMYFYDKGTLIAEQSGGIYKLNVNYSTPVTVQKMSNEIPQQFSLFQNYPNPFNPSTKILYELPKSTIVKITVYDVLGKEVMRLVNNEFKQAGKYSIEFNGNNLSSGVYFYKIEAGEYKLTKKMLLVK